MMLALPGSAYLYQGEELGLPEVTDLPADALQDPIVRRGNHGLPGRDGCRVPLPWTRSGPSFGFGGDGAWLPQPPWFADYAVEDQQDDPSSSLTMYRRALALRRALQRPDATVTWLSVDDREVLHFRRTGGWECFINFSTEHKLLPGGEVLISSGLLDCRTAPPESTTWLRGVCDEYRAP